VWAGAYLSDDATAIELPEKPDVTNVNDTTEIYLRLAALDLEDLSEIEGFVTEFGLLGIARNLFDEFRDLPLFEAKALDSLRSSWPSWRAQEFRRATETREQMTPWESVEEFRFGARLIRDLVVARLAIQGEDEHVRWASRWLPSPSRVGPAKLLCAALDPALKVFHPRLVVFEPSDDYAPTAEPHPAEVTLYQTCALELFNHIVESATYKRCQNERCPRAGVLFVRQQGRSKYGHHRLKGVKYCSHECARAQVQREYRRKKRVQRQSSAVSISGRKR
jgi:hypothetical protein